MTKSIPAPAALLAMLLLAGCGELLPAASSDDADVAERRPDAPVPPPSSAVGPAAPPADAFAFTPRLGASLYADSFDRPDGLVDGGWRDKASEFRIASNALAHRTAGRLLDHLMLRPDAAPLDAEARTRVHLAAGAAMVLVRSAPESSASGRLTAYALRVDASGLAELVRYRSPSLEDQREEVLTSARFEPRTDVRLAVRALGAGPVRLEAGVFAASGGPPLASLSAEDEGGERLGAPGPAGLGASEAGAAFDDFEVRS